MTEEWRPVPGWEECYEISSRGRVRSIPRFVQGRWGPLWVPGGILKPQGWGRRREYLAVGLRRGGAKIKKMAIHQLVLIAFVGPRPPGYVACHNNGIHTDNRLENLRWDTESSNVIDSVKHGTHPESRKSCCKRGHPFDENNTHIEPKTGYRYCRRCRTMSQAARRRQQRNAVA